MVYSPISQRKYNNKCNRIYLKYTEKETNEYKRVMDYTEKNNIAMSSYIKDLIKADLDKKNAPYPDPQP